MFFYKTSYLNTTDEIDVVSIIHDVKYAIRDSKSPDGLLTIVVPHAGAGLVIMPNIESAVNELKTTMEVFASETGSGTDRIKREHEIGALMQSALLGRTLHLPFQDGKLLLDFYDDIFMVDFTHKGRRREFVIQIISEAPQEDQPKKGQPPANKRPSPKK